MVRSRPLSGDKNTTADTPDTAMDAADVTASLDKHSSTRPCLVVGIGASGGGQEALEQLFSAMPTDCSLAYVVIMHLHPDGPSYLPEILGRCTSMPVLTAQDGMPLQPDTVHVIPPGTNMTIFEGRVRIETADRTRGTHHPIDHFFHSLAADAAESGIAAILSGFGIDGSSGVKAVSEAGGAVLVQEPASAANPAMPRSAIATGAVDFVLPVEEIAPRIAEIARGSCVLPQRSCRVHSLDDELGAIFRIVKLKTGHDFSSYKMNTVMRRIERRMAMNEVSGIGKYIALIEENPLEAQALCQDILIGVTSFFRDPEAFEVLRQEIIPRLFEGRNPEEPVRIWHACCATGEEVYSMAILIQEYLHGHGQSAKVQLFATDIDEPAISQARAGLYPDDIEQDLGRERLSRFFTRHDGRWQVKKQIREMVVFAHHSLIKDPPFSRLDLLVCRNFLIYLNHDMQKRLIPLFHQVLKTGGILFLGSSETVGRNSELFSTIDNKWKIFERLESKRRMETIFPLSTSVRMPMVHRPERPAEASEPSPGMVAERILMERYSPPCVVVSDRLEVVHVSTRLSRFLEVPTGEPTRDILRMAREDLRPTLRAAIYKAFAEQKRIEFRGVKVIVEGCDTPVNLIVEPLGPTPGSRLAMVVFEPGAPPATLTDISGGERTPAGETSKEMLIHQLEEQLRITHEQLQATSEQLETSNEGFMSANEELMSINEEFQSANEELQSTNEELETSKEELQALNEELITVNAELQGKVEELNQANSDRENLLASSGIATIFLDRDLHIRGFTPAVADIFNLIPADIGRPFQHLAGKIDWTTLSRDAETVLAGQPFAEEEITTLEKGRCYLKRIIPYRNQDGRVDGIVVTFIDITERKRAEVALRESEEHVRHKLDSILSPEGDIGNLDLGDIIDARSLQSLVDDFYELTGMPMGLIDLKGKVLVGVGWQDVCTKFHRVNPETCRNCVESDVQLSAGVPHGEYKIYKCKNHMWDVATPVMVGDRHFGNLFMGQFFFEDEPLDYELFRSQARQYGFDEQEYIAALEAVPRLNRETLNTSMAFFMKLADILSKLSYSNIKLARSLAERDALMESLRENEERLNRAQEISHLGSWELDLVKNRLTWSDEVYRIFGLQPQEFDATYEAFLEAVHPDDRAAVDAAYSNSLREGRDTYEIEHRVVGKSSGEVRIVLEKCEHIRDVSGRIIRSIGMVHDITERKRVEVELRHAKEEWELTFNSVPDLIAIIDDRHRVVRVNQAMAKRLGCEPDECVGKQCYEVIHGSNIPPEFCPHTKTMDDGEEHNVELHAEQLEADYLVSTTPLFDLQGRMTGTVHVARDITERKQTEEELRRAKEAAEAATRAKSRFLANMSHELRTPMTGVLGMLDLTLSTSLDDKQRECICTAHNSARSLLRIINDILDLTKIEAGRLSLEDKPFSPRECVAGAVDILIPEARRKGLSLIHSVAEGLPLNMVGDQVRLRQVLVNLIGNAVKFTEQGKVEVRVTGGGAKTDGKHEITFTVLDTGIGIPAEKKHLLFNSFSQVDDSNTRRYGGTGLGLAICKEIVELMGGQISFESTEGEGSAFFFTVSLEKAEVECGTGCTPDAQTQVDSASLPIDEGEKPQLLLAEDDPTIRRLLETMLRISNFETEIAENGQKAVEMWERGDYDLILMDVQMPVMDGFSATRAIREMEESRGGHTLIVAMTAHALKQDEERCLEAGMDAYISKPVDMKASIALIKDLISQRDQA